MKKLPLRKYPSITALQCFEASARQMSFTKAAEELHMTQSAVSKQVAHLEETIEQKLFVRTSQYLQITVAGNTYLDAIVPILECVETATLGMLAYDREIQQLKIAAHPTLCSHWLTPLLCGFGKMYPNIQLDIRDKIVNEIRESSESFDIAFLFGDGLWVGMQAIKIFDEQSIVVCAPSLYKKINQAIDLTSYVYLQVRSRPTMWHEYFLAQHVKIKSSFNGPKFDTFYACIQAAESGCGLALVPRIFVQKEIDEGRLVCPWKYQFTHNNSYYLVYPTENQGVAKIQAMIEWVTQRLDVDK